MKWFKHMTDANRDEMLVDLRDQFGYEGYGRYWHLLEIIGEQMDKTDRCSVVYPWSKWCGDLAVTRPKLRRFLTAIQDQNGLVFIEHGNKLEIKIPKLLKIKDEYSKKSGHSPDKSPDKLRSKEVEVEVDKDKDKEKKKKENRAKALPPDFEISDEMLDWAIGQKFTHDLKKSTEKWKNSMLSSNRKYTDWVAAWRNGMIKAQEWYDEKSTSQNNSPPNNVEPINNPAFRPHPMLGGGQ